MWQLKKIKHWWAWLMLSFFYFTTHLWALTLLPVFADEAIYIRWSQLIISDWQRYLFFPLNDGKTPLFIWLLVPFEMCFRDPLWAGRFLMVIIGFFQVLVNGYLVKTLGGKTKASWLAMVLTTILPFWYFYHRQALIDGLLTLFLTLVVMSTAKLVQTRQTSKTAVMALPTREQWVWLLSLGITFGLALLTKIPAILILPVLPWWVLWSPEKTVRQRVQLLGYLGASLALGLAVFGTLKLNPAFGQLFSRGSDFLYPVSEIVAGRWKETLFNIPTYLDYFLKYTHIFVLTFLVASLFARPRRQFHILFWSAVIFSLPMAVMGKVVYARYFMPAMIFITASLSLYLETMVNRYVAADKNIKYQVAISLVVVLLLANVIASSLSFISVAVTAPNQLPLTASDQVQYLTEWSSGHGIPEVEAFIREQAKTSKVAVATEGFFGTLPDGLFMYFAAQPDPHVYIEGIGQPVRDIPVFFTQRAAGYDKKYLVVNSHRMFLKLPTKSLLFEVCRPFSAPCLQVWDLSEL